MSQLITGDHVIKFERNSFRVQGLGFQLSSKVVSRVRSPSVLDCSGAHSCRAIRCCDSAQVYDLCDDACGNWPPRKAITTLFKYCQSQSYCHSEIEVKAKATLVSFAGLERYREGYPGRPKVCGKTAQL